MKLKELLNIIPSTDYVRISEETGNDEEFRPVVEGDADAVVFVDDLAERDVTGVSSTVEVLITKED